MFKKKKNQSKQVMLKNQQKTNAQRELNKLMKDMTEEEKYHLLMASNQSLVSKVVQNQQAQVTLNAYRSAFLYLNETYLKKLTNDELSNDEKMKSIENMISYISTEAGKYVIEKAKHEQHAKNTSLEKEKNNE